MLKSGCQVGGLRLETWDGLEKAVTVNAAVAARIVSLRDLARESPEAPALEVLSEDEVEVLACHFGKGMKPSELTIGQAVLWIGRLGGHLKRNRDGMPGVRTLWRGFHDLTLLVAGFRAAKKGRETVFPLVSLCPSRLASPGEHYCNRRSEKHQQKRSSIMGTKTFTGYGIGQEPARSPTFDRSSREARMTGSQTRRRVWTVWLGILVVLGAGAAWTTSRAQAPDAKGSSGRPEQVLIIRHAEKPDDSSDDGEANDRGLSTTGHEARPRWPMTSRPCSPSRISSSPPRISKHSKRPGDTIKPLAQRLKLEINQDFPDDGYCDLAKEILNNPKYAGKRILICWHHGTLPDLAAALKAPVPPDKRKWPGKVFDRVWQLDYSGGEVTLTDLPQRLLYGDSSN